MGEGRIQELDTSKYDEITAVFNPKSKIQNLKSKIGLAEACGSRTHPSTLSRTRRRF